MAKINQGIYYLRLEDTDRNRLQPETANILLSALTEIGLQPDEGLTLEKIGDPDSFYGVYQKGQFGPYIQSERLNIYHKYAQELIDKKLAYWSYITIEEKEELQQIKNVTKKPINYLKENLEKHPEKEEKLYQSVENGLQDEQKPALLYKIQRNEKIICEDELLGQTEFDLSLEEDFAILKSDGYPTYHLAHLADDYEMQTTMVIRSQEWYPSIARHQIMFKDFFGKVPQYLHLPVILGETGNKKMSKRDGNVNLQSYLDQGYLPETIINYIAFLGWNPGTEKELYLESADFQTLNQKERLEKLISNLASDFSLNKLSKSPARFNLEKLNWFNKEYLKMMSLEEFALKSFENKITNSFKVFSEDTNNMGYRIGDYAFLIDLSKQKVFCIKKNNYSKHFGGHHYLIGGGRKTGESPLENLAREVDEETYEKVEINPDKAKHITSFRVQKDFEYPGEGFYSGRELNIYFYEVKVEALEAYELDDIGKYWVEWVDIVDFVENNDYLTYPIWRAFCQENSLLVFEPTENIQKQYLAWSLDKNRITTLNEFGIESDCILDWQKPDLEIVKWKKSTLEESLANLVEIADEITMLYKEYEGQQKKLYKSFLTRDVELEYNQAVTFWEIKLKNWLQENNKDTGSYLWPLRVVLSGKVKSPSPFELLAILKLSEVHQRIRLLSDKTTKSIA